MPELAVINAGELVTCAGRGTTAGEKLGIIEDGALLAEGGRVVWLGHMKEFRRKAIGRARRTIDARGNLVMPGFVDPHTHLVFAGTREDELERKVSGESYTSILSSGGGILRTIRDTRSASAKEIAKESLGRLSQLMKNGVTTAEVKTGYGQSVKDEMKLLEAISILRKSSKVELVSTFLGLHATPPEFGYARDYVNYVVEEMLPKVADSKERPTFADAFCEAGVFSVRDCERYLKASRALGFRGKVHADEFQESGGASLAARLECVSADHLGSVDRTGIGEMASKGVVAVLLPGTSLFSGIPYADARMFTESGCRVALGTDLSPNSWIESPQMIMSLACSGMKMLPAEAVLGFTKYAAAALGRDDIGSLSVGSSADLLVTSLPSHRFLPYRVGGSYIETVCKRGEELSSREASPN